MISASVSAVSGVVSAGLSTTVLPVASAGASFQAAISSGKFQGMICAGHAERARRGAEARVLELVGPAGVVEEVRRRERDVDVARLADRLAVVERLEHRELARALLDRARDAEQVLGALAARAGRARPTRRRGARPATAASTSAAPASATSASGVAVEGSIVATVSPVPARNSPFTKMP